MGDEFMSLFYEAINIKKWNFFEKIKEIGDIENFFM